MIENCNFTNRTYNCLKSAGIDTTQKLRMASDEKLLSIKNFGQASLREVKDYVSKMHMPKPAQKDPLL